MKIADLLYRDISERIEPVVKVYDRESLAQDLEQFVITDSLAKELRKFLDTFAGSLQIRIRGGRPSDAIGAWIYGFFGSGKSHVAKVLGHVLANETVRHDPDRTAIDLFLTHLDDPTLPGAGDLKALLQQVREKAFCLLIPFEIKSRQDQSNPESVTETCLRSFYRTLGFSDTPWVARLERRLQADGKYDGFCATYREQNGRDWAKDRQEHGFYLAELQAALATSLGKPGGEVEKMLDAYQRDHARVTAETLATEVVQYVDARAEIDKPRLPHVVFVIDEMGQFIGDSEDRIHELQSIVEQAGVIGQGRIWFICTSQEALEQVVDRTGLRLNQLGKLDARFDTKMPLTGEDVRRVVQDRLLRKREAQLPVLYSLYAKKEGLIEELCSLPVERHLAVIDRSSFADSYPFLPHTIPLVQELFNAMRGFKLSGTERSMIGVAQGALRALGDQAPGRLVSLDLVFDQQTDELSTSDYLGTAGMKFIREIDKQVPDQPIPPSRVLKALWLISKKADWIPRTSETLAKLLADSLDVETTQLRTDIEQCLDVLRRAGVVTRDEATGQYRYLSEQERSLEEEIADEISRYGVGTAKRRATQLLKEQVLTRVSLADYSIHLGTMRIPVSYSLELDGEPLRSGGDLEITLSSPLSRAKAKDLQRLTLAHGARGKTVWWNAAEDLDLVDVLKRLEALDKVPQKTRWRSDRSDQTQTILREKQKERDALQRHIVDRLRGALCTGTVYYAGEEVVLDGDKSLSEIAQEFLETVASHHYTQLAPGDVRYDDANITG
ncbi:BREX system P-loop protein BrxC [Candidatus Bipolaricaulota bacterium]